MNMDIIKNNQQLFGLKTWSRCRGSVVACPALLKSLTLQFSENITESILFHSLFCFLKRIVAFVLSGYHFAPHYQREKSAKAHLCRVSCFLVLNVLFQLFVICVDGAPRLNSCGEGTTFSAVSYKLFNCFQGAEHH